MSNSNHKIILLCVLISFNSVYNCPNLEDNLTVIFPKILRINDSTSISIESDSYISTDYQFSWKTDFGSIESSGNEVMYYAPDSECEARIDLEIYNQNKFVANHTFSISIFRQLIILKADDLIYDEKKIISDNWTRFLHFVVSEKIKTSVGLIGNSLETEDERYFYMLKYLTKTGYIELWNHGYDHLLNAQDSSRASYDEFRNKSFEDQKEQLRKAQSIAKEKLDLTIRTFGAPGNAIDSTTIQALNLFDEIKVWFFGLKDSSKMVLERSAEMEYPTGNPDYNSFIQNYNSSKVYLVFQIHPNQWDENQFNSFKEMILYLKEKRSTFILPFEYYNSVVRQQVN